MEPKDWFTVLAVLAGPILAVQAQKWIERLREQRSRRLRLFQTLMATRSVPLSPGHVEALNVIDVEFYGVDPVVKAWREYQDHLSHMPDENRDDANASAAALAAWAGKLPDLLADLLVQMAAHLRLPMDRVMLKRTAYQPKAHVDIEQEQAAIRRGLAAILWRSSSIGAALPIVDVTVRQEASLDPEAVRRNDEFHRLVTDFLAGARTIPVRVESARGATGAGEK